MDARSQRRVVDEEGRRARDLVEAALDGVQPLVTMSREGLALIALSPPDHASDLSGVPAFLLGEEALAAGALRIQELDSPTVPTVEAGAVGQPVLLLAGDTIVGGKQNRVINVTVWVDADATIQLPVTCLEHGRWNAGKRFSVGRQIDHAMRATLVDRMAAEGPARDVAGPGRFLADQGAVWAEIGHRQARSGVHSNTAALHDVYEQEATAARAFAAAFPCPTGAVGLAVGVGGRLIGLDLFADPSPLLRRWPRLVEGAVSAALDHRRAVAMGALPKPRQRYPDPAALDRMLGRARAALAEATVSPSVGRGTDVRFTGERVRGAALIVDDRLLHVELLRPAAL